MLVEFKDQPEFGIWNANPCHGLRNHYVEGYMWLTPTERSHPGLAALAGDAMIGVRRSAIRPVQTNPDQMELPL